MGKRGKNEFYKSWTWEIMEKRLLDAYYDIGVNS
jgi:hypothetical protein